MKSVLLSMRPKYCELIAIFGTKTVEIRKTKPKIDVPFKCYIYETQGRKYPFSVKVDTIAKHDDDRFLDCRRGAPEVKFDKHKVPYFSYWRMKVIGEFVCDLAISINRHDIVTGCSERGEFELQDAVGLDMSELLCYLGDTGIIWGWYISDLVIYDKPKELSEFSLTRPPQSWCYVEELK